MIKWTVSKSMASDPLSTNIFSMALDWLKRKLRGNRLLELPVSITKPRPLNGSLIKKQVREEGCIVIRKRIDSIPTLWRTKVWLAADSLIP